ncbi:DUF1501 domain-containing protein [Winogradskya consettensis]|nr:DUF1501 domain-containing protein [Actinoplanes consettensis]
MTDASCCTTTTTTTTSRRRFLGTAAAAGALIGFGADQISTQLAYAAGPYSGDVFVLLSLRGGFDGLSAIVPAFDADYYAARPTIAVPRSQLLGDDPRFGLHPALKPLLPLWNAGTFGAIHAAGQPTPNRSHFAAMEELERAAPGTSVRTGWLNRVLGGLGATTPMNGMAVGSFMPARVMAGPSPELDLSSIDGFALAGEAKYQPMTATMTGLYAGVPGIMGDTATRLASALGTMKTATAAQPASSTQYPANPLGKALRDVARLIKSDVGLMSACVDSGDWDMHENLGTAAPGKKMYDNLTQLAAALAAFAADLGPDAMKRVTLITVSEFGRRVAENGSAGLDHGYGNAMLMLGGSINGGQVHGTWPGLGDRSLVDGDLKVTTDYRAVIAEILQKRCGLTNVGSVFPNVTPTTLGVVKSR